MKARFIQRDVRYVPDPSSKWQPSDNDFHYVEIMQNGVVAPRKCWKKGAIVDHPESYYLVKMGMAEPADGECEARCHQTERQKTAVQYAYERQKRGIHPDDFEAYDRGEMIGYNADGTFIAGPSAMTFADADEFEEEDE